MKAWLLCTSNDTLVASKSWKSRITSFFCS